MSRILAACIVADLGFAVWALFARDYVGATAGFCLAIFCWQVSELNWRIRRRKPDDGHVHRWRGTPLPEDEFGLYAFSRMECTLCGYRDPYFEP